MLLGKWSIRWGVVCSAAAFMSVTTHAVPLIEYSAGHADLGVAYENSELDLHYHFDTNAVLDGVIQGVESEYDVDEVYTRVPDSQVFSRLDGAEWDFLGVAAQETVWFLPQRNALGAPFLGVGAEALGFDDWTGPISYEFSVVDMPDGAAFSIWRTNAFGTPTVQVATSLAGADSFEVSVGSHTHFNWGFTSEGIYQIRLTATGEHRVDGLVDDTGVIWFAVGDATVIPEPASAVLVAGGLLLMRRRRGGA